MVVTSRVKRVTVHFSDVSYNRFIVSSAGVFVSKQKGDTDMGSKVPKDILVKGESGRKFSGVGYVGINQGCSTGRIRISHLLIDRPFSVFNNKSLVHPGALVVYPAYHQWWSPRMCVMSC